MITCLIASLVLQSPAIQVPARRSRIAFWTALQRVEKENSKLSQTVEYPETVALSMAQVRAILGPPDDILRYGDDVPYGFEKQDERWSYGTNGHNTFPTLGFVNFSNGKVNEIFGYQGTPPQPNIVSDAELTAALGAMHFKPLSRDENASILHLIKVSNLLIPKGQQKALAILGEFARIEYRWNTEWLFWLSRAMFTSDLPGGVFPIPGLGSMHPVPPENLAQWPTYPLLSIDDIPFNLYHGATLRGVKEEFRFNFAENQKHWTLRPTAIVPSDDPFLSYQKLFSDSVWPLKGDQSSKEKILDDVLDLVKSAYRPSAETPDTFDAYHNEFLELRCRWDSARNEYVRMDGTTLPPSEFGTSPGEFTFKDIPELEASVSWERVTPDELKLVLKVKELQPDVYAHLLLFGEKYQSSFDSFHIEDIPAEGRTYNHKFSLPQNRRMRFAIKIKDKVYESPYMRP